METRPGPKPRPAHERVLARVAIVPESQCWRFTGAHNRDGYGQVGREGIGSEALVHRVVYAALVGPIPDGYVIDHVETTGCRFRDCVNPEHLEAVTKSENLLRSARVGKWNALKARCPKCGGEFERKRTGKRQRWCRGCTNTQIRERNAAKPKKMLTCESCLTDFPKNAGRPAKWCPTCR